MADAEYQQGKYTISTDKSKLDVLLIHRFLSQSSYWAQGRTVPAVAASIANSLCFGVYSQEDGQVGFGRAVTDSATLAWLCDIFILPAHQGRGLGKWLVQTMVSHPALKDLRRLLLATRDAHELYRRYGGFNSLQAPEMWMERLPAG